MNLKKLELFGFKSFMRKLDIHFSDGITVIVGPNGCGKTNVTDALRWVLGEGNARMLRGNKMEDLIFNGTRDYKPLNVAEVSLTIDNSSGVLPVDYTEVTVTRRVFRDGDPEFLINRVPVLLRDIHDLFLDTGLGSRAYSVIERGMVEMVLSDQPEKRRELLEEAAGIMKYKIRERLAQRKLAATDEDMRRLSDVLREVERQVRMLKRQVGQAQRFQEVRDRFRDLEIALATADVEEMRRKVESLRAALAEDVTERDGAAARVAAVAAGVETLRAESAEADRALSSRSREVDEFAERARAVESSNLVKRERRESLLAEAKRLGLEKEELAGRIRDGAGRRETLEASARVVEARAAEVAELLRLSEERLARVESDLESRKSMLAAAREAVEDASLAVGRLGAELANVEARADHLSDRDAVLVEELREIDGVTGARRSEREETERRIERARAEVEARDRELEEARRRRDEVEAERERARDEAARLAVEEESARSGLAMLRDLQENREGFGRGARSLLSGEVGGRRLASLAESLHVTRPDLVPALESALAAAVEWVVAPDAESAIGSIRALKESEGRATVVDVSAFRGSPLPSDGAPRDPAILGPARAFLTVSGELAKVLDALLARALIVETLDDALRIARREDARGFRLVARDGDWVEAPGIVHGGAQVRADARILGRADRIAELERGLATTAEKRSRASERVTALGADRERIGLRASELEELRDRAREELVREERAAERTRAEIEGSEARRASVRAEREELEQRRRELAKEREARLAAAAEAERIRTGLEEEWKGRETELTASSEDRDRMRGECHELLLEKQRLAAEIEKIAVEIARIEEARQADDAGIAQRDVRIEETDRAVGALDRELEAGLAEFAARTAELEERRRVRDGVAEERARVLEKLREVEDERGRWSRLRDEAGELVHEHEMSVQKLEAARDELVHRVEREFSVNLGLPGSVEAHGSLVGADPEIVEAARREHEELRRQMERMGAVNLVALDQYEREAKRWEFLRTQRDDLEAAREKLRRTIRKINRTARTLFMQTLASVRVNFQTTYGTLFEGGVADIRLAGDEDPLHAPIEIVARPRGKRLNNIHLLSSGERALTAVAFLFAIYLVKPSPFCILDEVDAPLDDANIGRFVDMLRKVSERTQFVMITHNKKTMEAADYLYGVTMEEPGVSKLVSVHLGKGGLPVFGAPPAIEARKGGAAEPDRELVMEGSA
jgi:chromosome segregation protein